MSLNSQKDYLHNVRGPEGRQVKKDARALTHPVSTGNNETRGHGHHPQVPQTLPPHLGSPESQQLILDAHHTSQSLYRQTQPYQSQPQLSQPYQQVPQQLYHQQARYKHPIHPQQHGHVLRDIPEAVSSQDAPAAHAAMVERHRLQSNAFYQQARQTSQTAPPTAIHPALRAGNGPSPAATSQNSRSGKSTAPPDAFWGDSPHPPPNAPLPPIPAIVPSAASGLATAAGRAPPRPLRPSAAAALAEITKKEDFKPLDIQLAPTHQGTAVPTHRALLEQRREQDLQAEHAPVHAAKLRFVDAEHGSSSSAVDARHALREEQGANTTPASASQSTKTSKRSLLNKFRLPHVLTGSTPTPSVTQERNSTMPAKARAVLGSSPPKMSRPSFGGPASSKFDLPRSPSKRKGFFGRIAPGEGGLSNTLLSQMPFRNDQSAASASVSAATRRSKAAITDFARSSALHARRHSSVFGLARSQSLKYFEHAVPPTPPAKNTPPHQGPLRDGPSIPPSTRITQPDGTLTYGRRPAPKLITQQSIYSLHASVVPEMTDAKTFEEMKARMGGLQLEGFNMPGETVRRTNAASVIDTRPKTTRPLSSDISTSPSLYSTDGNARPSSSFFSARADSPTLGGAGPGLILAELLPVNTASSGHDGPRKPSDSSSNAMTVPIVYPDVVKDSMAVAPARPADGVLSKQDQGKVHNHTVSLRRNSEGSSLYSDRDGMFRPEMVQKYPVTSAIYSHRSALVPPLQFLPSSKFSPPPRLFHPPRTSSRNRNADVSGEDVSQLNGVATGIDVRQPDTHPSTVVGAKPCEPQPAPTRPRRSDDAPKSVSRLPQSTKKGCRPSGNLTASAFDTSTLAEKGVHVDVDPVKSLSPSQRAEQDPLALILSKIQLRDAEFNSMRDELRASTLRMNERLAVIERLQRDSTPTTPLLLPQAIAAWLEKDSGGPILSSVEDNEGTFALGSKQRIPTDAALEFYRTLQTGQTPQPDDSSAQPQSQSQQLLQLLQQQPIDSPAFPRVAEQSERASSAAQLGEQYAQMAESVNVLTARIRNLEGDKVERERENARLRERERVLVERERKYMNMF